MYFFFGLVCCYVWCERKLIFFFDSERGIKVMYLFVVYILLIVSEYFFYVCESLLLKRMVLY